MTHGILIRRSTTLCVPIYPLFAHLPSVCPFASVWIVSMQIASIQAAHCRQSVPLAIVHRFHNLGPTCGTYHCGENMENAVEETDNRILKETECHTWKRVFKEFDSVRFNVSSLLVLYTRI